MAQVFSGWLGSQEDGELTFQPPVVKVEELAAPGGMGLWCVQLQLLKRLGNCVETPIVP